MPEFVVDLAADAGPFACCDRTMVAEESGGWSYFYCETCRRAVDVNPVPLPHAPSAQPDAHSDELVSPPPTGPDAGVGRS